MKFYYFSEVRDGQYTADYIEAESAAQANERAAAIGCKSKCYPGYYNLHDFNLKKGSLWRKEEPQPYEAITGRLHFDNGNVLYSIQNWNE